MAMTRNRVRSFINEYGTEGVYISFSGGKDSTVLMDIIRKEDSRIPAVFVDTWLEYPQIRQFVKKQENVIVLKPSMGLKDIISQYGWCFPSKDVAQAIWYARKGKQRTGCMFCPVGCHLTGFRKFKWLKKFNPRLFDYCMEELGEKKLLDWVKKNYCRGGRNTAA
ncbi:phosphoadenosine phosphosulfate reductase family protein [Enterocloster clostridioformis]|uniref:phosphoadenosine phosphosulfate reductase domain-containing protein n=1 Tax=Enterocloster clostridioformis TaxID=1531 RepID=UPI00267682CE|nr:phosphoadenosine phosphosulfate reductase family protein [Enterocloster clostridioformis]